MTIWIRNKVIAIFKTIEKCKQPCCKSYIFIIYACNNLILFRTNCLRMESKHLYTIHLWGYAPNKVSMFLKPN